MERTIAAVGLARRIAPALVIGALALAPRVLLASEPIVDPVDILVEGVATESQVGRAVKAALTRRGWVPGAEKTRYMEGTLIKPDQYRVKIGIEYDAKGVTVRYLESDGLDYDASDKSIRGSYNKWMRMLSKEISVNLTLFASGEPEVVSGPSLVPLPVRVIPVGPPPASAPAPAPAATPSPAATPAAAAPAETPASASVPAPAPAVASAAAPSQLRAGAEMHAQAKLASPLMGKNAALTGVTPKGPIRNAEGTWWYVSAGGVSGWVLQSDLQ